MKKLTLIFFSILMIQNAFSQKSKIQIDTLARYFNEVKQICTKDNGKLWGRNLWSPIIVIDRDSRFFVANENDSTNSLEHENNVFYGYFPENLIIANSTTDFGGKLWTMLAYPLPIEQIDREILITHEMFHRLQKEIWTGNTGFSISHMENEQARILIKLEWNALFEAINAKKGQQKKAIHDALIFNYYRKSLYPGSDSMENRFEIMEGLAEYTGIRLCIQNDQEIVNRINNKKMFFWNSASYTRSFGYLSGILYAFLLDFSKNQWHNKINTNSDLQLMLQNQLKIEVGKDLENEYYRLKNNYGYAQIFLFEENRASEIQKTIAAYKEKLLLKSHLTLKFMNMKIGFNPMNLVTIDSIGTVYPNVQIIDDWGILKVEKGGCLVNNSWSEASINAENIIISENTISGTDWVLKLNDNWKISKDGENYILIKN